MYIEGGEATIENNVFEDNHCDISVYDAKVVIRNNLMRNSFLENIEDRSQYVIHIAGVSLLNTRYAIVHNNTINYAMNGIYGQLANNCTLTNNSFSKTGEGGFQFWNCWNNTISFNDFYSSGTNAVALYKICGNNVVTYNTMDGQNERKSTDGITILHGMNNLIQGNFITNYQAGIRLAYSNGNVVADNLVEQVGIGEYHMFAGIDLHWSKNNSVIGNTVKSSNRGILLWSPSSQNVVENNDVENSGVGIALHYSANDNLVRGNNVTSCRVGIVLEETSNNTLFQNNFISNELQGYDDGNNQWTYQGEGNYWSDSQVDEYSILPNGTDSKPLLSPASQYVATLPSIGIHEYIASQDQQIQITNSVVIEGKNMVEGSYLVEDGGNLTNKDASICFDKNGQSCGITVMAGGTLYIINSTINATETGLGYLMDAFARSHITIRNSNFTGMGPFVWDWGGFFIAGDNAILENNIFDYYNCCIFIGNNTSILNNKFLHSMEALYVSGGYHTIENNSISRFICEGMLLGGENYVVENNLIDGSYGLSNLNLPFSSERVNFVSIYSCFKGVYCLLNV
jgi:parallel beta-helix repeat protein